MLHKLLNYILPYLFASQIFNFMQFYLIILPCAQKSSYFTASDELRCVESGQPPLKSNSFESNVLQAHIQLSILTSLKILLHNLSS